MFTKLGATKRHNQLMRAAEHLVREAVLNSRDPEQVTAIEVAALAFAWYQLQLEESEATQYLAAALISRGHGIDHLPAVPA